MNELLTKYRNFWICLILTLATFTIFYQVRGFGFVNIDDSLYVSKNQNIQGGITLKTFKWAFTATRAGNWHPLTWLSHTLDWQLFGSNPAGHHLVNLIFHIVNTLLLFLVLKQMTNALWQSAFVAALFALHPLHVESVAWIAERKDVLGTFFWMLTMWAYMRFVLKMKTAPLLSRLCNYHYLLVVVFFAFGLMAKPMLVTLPFVLLLLDYWPLGRIGRFNWQTIYRLVLEKIPFIILSAVSSVITFLVERNRGAVIELVDLSLKLRIYNALISYAKYIGMMIWPSRLAAFYPLHPYKLTIWYTGWALLLLLAISILVFRLAASHKYLFTGWLWYLGAFLPVIGLVQVGDQAMADRYTYITLTGLFIIIAWGLPDLLAKWQYKKNVLTLSALLVILIMSVCTYSQLHYWRNSLTLFQHALDTTEDNYVAHFCVAGALVSQNEMDEAIGHYSEVIRIEPGYLPARVAMGDIFRNTGRLDRAVEEYRKALLLRPNEPDVLNSLGIVFTRQGKFDEAVECFEQALRIRPDFADAHANAGRALVLQGNPDQAIQHFEEALRLKPDWIDPMNGLAWFLAASGETVAHNPGKAIRLALRACELTNYKRPELLDTLAVAYAAAGDFNNAVETAEKALGLCQSPERSTLKKEIENRLVLFKAGKPYIEPLLP